MRWVLCVFPNEFRHFQAFVLRLFPMSPQPRILPILPSLHMQPNTLKGYEVSSSSSRSVSWIAVRKTASEKIGEKRGDRK